LDLTSNTKSLMFVLISGNIVQYSRKGININLFIANITGYCIFHGKIADHIPFATIGYTHKRLGTAGL